MSEVYQLVFKNNLENNDDEEIKNFEIDSFKKVESLSDITQIAAGENHLAF